MIEVEMAFGGGFKGYMGKKSGNSRKGGKKLKLKFDFEFSGQNIEFYPPPSLTLSNASPLCQMDAVSTIPHSFPIPDPHTAPT